MEKITVSLMRAFLSFSLVALLCLPIHARASSEADTLNEAGVKLANDGETDQAMIKFRDAVALDPKHAKAQYNLGEAAYELKQWDAAQSAYVSYLALDQGTQEEKDGLIKKLVILRKDHGEAPPESTLAMIASAKKSAEAKKYSEAEKNLIAAQKSAPWVLDSTQELAYLYAFQGDEKAAREQVTNFSKYAALSSDTEQVNAKVNSLLAQKKSVEDSKSEADKAESASEGFRKHGGVSLSYLYGFGILGNTASDDGIKKYSYKDVFSGSSGFDINVFFANPDRLMMYRAGFVQEKFAAKSDSPKLAVTPKGVSGNASVMPTNVTSNTGYLGIGLKGDYLYAILDVGLSQLSSEDLAAPVTLGGVPVSKVPTNTGAIAYCAFSVGIHVPISSYFSLSLEGRIGGPVGRAFYHRGPDAQENSVPSSEWISSNKLLGGLIYRF